MAFVSVSLFRCVTCLCVRVGGVCMLYARMCVACDGERDGVCVGGGCVCLSNRS